ncbi:L-threonylcarbamoyladenylate synthase [Wolbachia endosymbiont of Listronotus oregonensis]|uniref:L-threonylcarbamoyladenylate synthase n=1 Tax=unclassified Wolbachia TaxID=2640676 RepID=UPI00209E97D1|nr:MULTISPECIES: L-threonylcarbamoyladenylate synthase [Rickettsiales]MBV2145518.1 threonylcarbamoyl-AMP synthase [Wolbachia endosymbiont of Pissodes strobi]MDX5495860.1 L-threonylcarbamoyladenylate synthase [Wolbachia endosymbiont of Nomada marshamella]WMT83852.1 L-threonylcarbamoyladenylate synthase [Wolbachia endosymbiont of Listronotus oregonensis]
MVSKIINAIQNNLLVCFPTETVYALACNALNNESIGKIYQIKKRSQNKPLSIFVSDICSLMRIAKLEKKYIGLVNHFSPGPITYILPLKNNNILPNEFFKDSIGIRIPEHPIAISILNKLKVPIVATSINISGEKSVCKADDIPQSIKQHLSAVIEDDELVSGIESTIIDLTEDKIKVLREGAILLQTVTNAFSN